MLRTPEPIAFDHALLALADPTRRRILDHLARGESRITEVAALFPISLNSVSKHIKVLERGNLVQRRVVGREHFLRINPRPLDAIASWIATQQVFWKSSLGALDIMLQQSANDPSSDKKKRR